MILKHFLCPTSALCYVQTKKLLAIKVLKRRSVNKCVTGGSHALTQTFLFVLTR